MKPVRIKDNNKEINKEALSDAKNLVGIIADKTLEQLEKEGVFIFPEAVKESDDLEEKQMILKTVNGKYESGNIMGFLGYGDERLVIESRFSDEGEDYLFMYLLEHAAGFPDIVKLKTDADRDDRLFNYLVFLFPYYLKKAMRKGPFKVYIKKEYNDDNVKGSIDIARHIKQNTPFIGSIAYNQREFSYDNYLLELVRHTIEYIKGKPYGSSLISSARDEVNLIIGSTPGYKINDRQKIIHVNKKTPVRNAYYKEYSALQRLCLLILQHQKHQIGSGRRQIYGILFDGAWLWEEYINTLLKDNFHHPMNKKRKGHQYLFFGSVGKIYPDFISKESEPRIIADAKYKPKENIGGSDYLQVLAYMFRFDSKTGYYIYPDNEKQGREELYLNRGTTFERNIEKRDDTCVIKLGLSIPNDADNYNDFKSKMKESEQSFKQALIP